MGSDGHSTIGGVLSTTVTIAVQLTQLPSASHAVAITGVGPKGNGVPTGGFCITITPGQLSVAVATAGQGAVKSGPADSSLSVQVITGGSVSATLMVKVQVAVLPEVSVAVQVTTVAPAGKVEPEGGLQLQVTPGQLSVAVQGG